MFEHTAQIAPMRPHLPSGEVSRKQTGHREPRGKRGRNDKYKDHLRRATHARRA